MVRKMEQRDEQDFLDMMDGFHHSPAVLHSIPREYMETTFRIVMEDSPYAKCYMLEKDGKIAGYALLALTYSNEVGGMVVWVEEVLVKKEFRGMGLGTELFDFLNQEFPEAKRFRLEVAKDNVRAMKLYNMIGYENLDYLQMIQDL